MIRRPPRSTRTDTLFPYTTLFRSYARHLRHDSARRPVIVGHLLEVVSDLYHYRDRLAGGGLAFEPWAGQAPARVAGYRHVVENRTPRFPEAVIAARSEERRGGKECVRTGRFRGAPYTKQKKNTS